ncbi:hypothetical protein ISF_02913 [Cordyceps fumosorosea ARSEF 2679]|uniref:Uncharacterized protein n=1 Tax=Cordyceps fumosorosea (strain ARSEF 2679) TaxID=1081104 RepID=A0A168B5E8_CORFA|nr:hypothetical protein ISF_02913 [Cordyceps fumosorosea ARSEF 2679]OAA69643.1 hypothetical protein ISF_02913 [Cordyceps fumosorosea ARSEF 2679]
MLEQNNLQTFVTPPEDLEKLLLAHLPDSLTLLRKVQYLRRRASLSKAKFPQILLASSPSPSPSDGVPVANGGQVPPRQPPRSFTMAYISTTVAQSTSMYLYSTLQDDPEPPGATAVAETEGQLETILHALIRLRRVVQDGVRPNLQATVVLGSLHSRIRGLWEKTGRVVPRPGGHYDKWLFDLGQVPRLDESLPEDMVWGSGSLQDCEVVASRTDIPRPVEYLVQMPSLFIKLLDGTPVSWAFLDSVGSLISVHCEVCVLFSFD